MITFRKNFEKLLPYNRQHYREFWLDDFDSPVDWYGVSFQLPGAFEGKEFDLKEFVEKYKSWFKTVISGLDSGTFWIVNHDDMDWKWFPNDEDNLPALRTLFKQYNVPNTFKGALIFTKDDLLKLSDDIISYPSAVFNEEGMLYRSLDISHGELPFIIKVYGRSSIDLLSTNKDLMKKVVTENSQSDFIVREFRGTSL